MKSRRIFAAVMASVCAVSATAVAAAATETTDKVLNNTPTTIGNWDKNVEVPKDDLKDAKAGDQLVIATSGVATDAEKPGQIAIKYDATDWPALPGFQAATDDKGYCNLDATAKAYTYTLTAEDLTAINSASKVIIGGQFYTIDSVTLKPAVTADPDTPAGDKDDNKDDNKPGDSDKNDDKNDETKPGDSDKNDNKPGASDKETITNDVVVDKVLKGADLTKAIFGDSKKEWKDVESVTFESDDPFAVVFNVKAGKIKDDAKATKFIKGVTELAKDEDLPAKAFATKWTLSADEVAAMLDADAKADSLQLISKDGKKITVKATVTTKAASKPDDNKNTGIALVVAPVVLAGAAVAVAAISKKRK